jgi:tRNA nucleotidyltransferase (CCA-adding enzyme)
MFKKFVKVYLVGGAVRDMVLGKPVQDRDYVVVNASPQMMLDFGFKAVEADFPVFIHPETNEEYALARRDIPTEDYGYHGFRYEWEGVTLEEDLFRRDLTVNAMAQDLMTDEIIDPYDGLKDAKNKVFRHVSTYFKDDPLRVLRLGRFLSRMPDWTIAPITDIMVKNMIRGGMLDYLTAERVWKEIERTLAEPKPSRFFELIIKDGNHTTFCPTLTEMLTLSETSDHHPEDTVWTHTMMVLDHAAATWQDPVISFAALCHDFGKPATFKQYGKMHGHEIAGTVTVIDWADKIRAPAAFKQLAVLTCRYHTLVHTAFQLKSKTIEKMLRDCNAYAKPDVFLSMLKACESDARGRGIPDCINAAHSTEYFLNKPYLQREYLIDCLQAALAVNVKAVNSAAIAKGKTGVFIKEYLNQQRAIEIEAVKKEWLQRLEHTSNPEV